MSETMFGIAQREISTSKTEFCTVQRKKEKTEKKNWNKVRYCAETNLKQRLVLYREKSETGYK